MRRLLAGSLALVLGAAAGSIALAASTGTTLRDGRPPAPSTDSLPFRFHGTFANPRWGGSIDLTLSLDGGTLLDVAGIAPGVCEDRDFGHLVAGKDGATGPTFFAYQSARIGANGSFSMSQRRPGQRIPFKPKWSVAVSGTFDGNTVRGKLRASMTTRIDACRANASFEARRIG